MITNRIFELARSQPESTAIVWKNLKYNYATFSRAIIATRNYFETQTVPRSGIILVVSKSILDCWIIILALRDIGVDTISVLSLAQAETLELLKAECIVLAPGEDKEYKGGPTPIWSNRVITVPDDICRNIYVGNLPSVQQDSGRYGSHILYTSGTTGAPKKVVMAGDKEEKRNKLTAKLYSYNAKTVFYAANFHLNTAVGFRSPSAVWYKGGSVIYDQPSENFTNFFANKISSSILAPSKLRSLLKTKESQQTSPKEFELFVGGGSLPLDMAESAARDLTEKIEVCYASTEIIGITLCSHFRTIDDLLWLSPVKGRRLEVVDESMRECPVGREGELRIAVTEVDAHSYLNDAVASARVFRDGFFYPGDLAVRRGDGRLRVLGRAADVLNLQGHKVAVAPIEQAFEKYLSVDEVCLFSGLNNQGEDEVVIAIKTDRPIPQSTMDELTLRFPSIKHLRFEVMKDFPSSSTGMKKTQRRVLRRLLFDN